MCVSSGVKMDGIQLRILNGEENINFGSVYSQEADLFSIKLGKEV